MLKRSLMSLVAVMVGVFAVVAFATPVSAATCKKSKFTETNVLGKEYEVTKKDGTVLYTKRGICDDGKGGGIFDILNLILSILTFGVGTGATIGFVLTGYQYLTARDNEAQVAKAKMRMINIVIGLVAYAAMWTFLQWILPGGIFGDGS